MEESDLWGLFAMDTADELNTTQVEELELQSSNCCSTAGTINDENYLKLDDSTKLVAVQVVLILAYSTIILFGVIGNSLVIYVVFKFKNLRTVTNFFIVNLAVADLLVNTLCLPFTLVYTLYGEWKFGQVLCFMLPCSQGMAVHVSTITMNVIALDRHRSIVYLMETKMSKDMCAVVILITWAVSALLASPLAIFREYGTFDISPDESIQVCTEKWPESRMNGSIYSISALLIQYGLPLVINCVAYIRIWNKMKTHMIYGGRNDRHQRRQKTTKMLLTMVVVFAVSWLPFHAFQLAVDIDSTVLYMKDFKLLFTVFHIVAMCSTFVNPILYGWMNNNYRTAFLSVFKCYQPVNFSLRPRCSSGRETPKNEGGVCADCKSTNV
ncbi:neuropeptide Y receptor type 2 [Sebastes umbrosus]|uniref:neuropeptide Y receptor type 2 n=1 Tax=Sebastes umbrosus TaxID=72105 RepID=UPI0018A118C3|nr:neuropeptide Y receptor type 2 [Sebastes umbrosus]XP_037619296.1 neuropeptide Y receptor type 2 [Sebastes umbrosus]